MSQDPRYSTVDPAWALAQLEQRTGYRFVRPDLGLEALTHASGAVTREASNERLEFLGDAVLGFSTCEYLFNRFTDWSEGDLTQLKSLVVSRATCAEWARELRLQELLIVGKGVGMAGELPASLLANVLESILGAIYLDGGLQAVQTFLLPFVAAKTDEACLQQAESNYKSTLQTLVQRNAGRPPSYLVIDESGPDHDKSFCIAVQIGNRRFSPAWGKNKKQAEQRAAGNAIRELEEDPRGEVASLPAEPRSLHSASPVPETAEAEPARPGIAPGPGIATSPGIATGLNGD